MNERSLGFIECDYPSCKCPRHGRCGNASLAAVILTLPLPPSVNGLWANGKNLRRFRTQIYEDWINEAGWLLKQQRPAKLKGPVSIAYEFEEPKTKRKMDLANREKAATDLLVSMGVIEGDDQTIVRKMSLAWSESVKGVRIEITSIA